MISASDKVNIRGLIKQLQKKGYVVYDEPNKLNIVGIRANTTQANSFDDIIYVFYKDDNNQWKGKAYPATTDPGTYYLKDKILDKLGTAILKEGQYKDTYKIGMHNGKYEALVQTGGPVTVIRDYNRDAVLDFNNGREVTGWFGINIHRAKSSGVTNDVGQWSAGCQVFANSDDFNEFMALARKHKAKYGNSFTYTLIDERSYIRAMKRKGIYVAVAVILISAYVGYRAYYKKPIIPNLLDK